jgi:UPF0755 protein
MRLRGDAEPASRKPADQAAKGSESTRVVAGADRADGTRQRIVTGLPPQPSLNSTKNALRPNPPLGGLSKSGAAASGSAPAKERPATGPTKIAASPPGAGPVSGAAKFDLSALGLGEFDEPKPSASQPNSSKPSSSKPIAPKPSPAKADVAKSDLSKADLSKPDLAKADLPKLDLPKLDRPKPDLSKPDSSKSDPSKAQAGKSDVAKSGPVKLDLTKPDLADRGKSGKVAAAAASSGRVVVGLGEPEPPISGRADAPSVATALLEPKRIAPRSPRVALEPDHVPLPSRSSRPSRRARNPLVIVGNAIFTLLLLALLVGGGAAVIGKSRFEAPGPLEQEKVVNIPRAGMMEIADLLKREGVIDEHRIVFIGGVLALRARSDLKAGEYVFPKQASVRDVVETIMEGKVVQHQLTIPEGLTSEQIVARLLESDILAGNIKDVPREGSLLPDGYHFNRGFTREQIIKRRRDAQDRFVREVLERRNPDLPLKSPDQLVILASIIEKETGKPEERTRIAAIFANRLKQKMKLQTDPTVIYGLVYGKGSLGHPLTKSELAQSTPYNTYMIEGLPPGPICNPGRASIEAAANPARTKELYFAADGTGGHAFAETYDQHLKNVARLRVIEHGGDPAAAAAAPDAQAPAAPARPPAAAQRGKRSASGSGKSAAQ